MKLEPGKYYRTRSGSKAFVGAINPNTFGYCYAVGWDGDGEAANWGADGLRFPDEEYDQDLVSEWEEPKAPLEVTFDAYVEAVYGGPSGRDLIGTRLLYAEPKLDELHEKVVQIIVREKK